MEDLKKIEQLLNKSGVEQSDNIIAKELDCKIFKDNLPLLIGFIKTEIDASQLKIDDVELFIGAHNKQIADFARLLFEKYKPQSLSIGVSITYAIYMIYLKNKSKEELLGYLKRRRIPKPKRFLDQLMVVGKKSNL